MPPIKRDAHLQYLSQQHHQVLIVCWKIRTGITRPQRIASLKAFCSYFYTHYLVPHFNIEETLLYPVLGNNHELVKTALEAHHKISDLFKTAGTDIHLYDMLEKELNNHIRFEERVLFNEIQKLATPQQLAAIAAADTHNDKGFVSIEQWEDKFWE